MSAHVPPLSEGAARPCGCRAGGSYVAAFRAELSKLSSLPAVWLTLAGTVALTILLSFLFASEAAAAVASVGILDFGVAALGWSQIGFFLLGVIAAASEYVGGQIRTTLVAVPDRGLQRLAANSALALLSFSAALITVLAGIGTVTVASGTRFEELDGAVLARIVLSAAGYLACMTTLSAAIGLQMRRTIPAAAVLLVYLLIVSPLLQGQNWYFLPDMASYVLWYPTVPPGAPPAILCWLVVLAWTVAAVSSATIVFMRRDA